MEPEIGLKDFFSRAEHEARRYGSDDWIFIRELVQNSRDAQATLIEFQTLQDETGEFLTCYDNGQGMSHDDLEAFLLNLYASNKEENQDMLGFFGVGFWSTLRFEPESIEVFSRKNGFLSAVSISPESRRIQEVHSPEPFPHGNGTRIRLHRNKLTDGFEAIIRSKLIKFAQFIQPPQDIDSLKLVLNGEKLNTKLSSLPCLQFMKGHHFECAIDAGEESSFSLYHRGLLIHSCSRSDELFMNRPAEPIAFNPNIQLNLHQVMPLMDRQSIFEDPQLLRILNEVDQNCQHLHKKMVTSSFPLGIRYYLQQHLALIRLVFSIVLLLTVFAAGFVFFQKTGPKSYYAEKDITSIKIAPPSRQTSDVYPNVNQWFFQYSSKKLLFFPMGCLDPRSLMPDPAPSWDLLLPSSPLPLQPTDEDIQITFLARPTGVPFRLPIPNGFTVIPESLRLDQQPFRDVKWNSDGTVWMLFSSPGLLTFSISKWENATPPNQHLISAPTSFPPVIQVFVDSQTEVGIKEKIEQLIGFFEQHFQYTNFSKRVSQNPDTSLHSGWLEAMVQSGEGDCDLLNGLGVQMLNAMGVPSRLEYGLVGRNGRAESDLHAWILYFDTSWKQLDLTSFLNKPPETTRSPAPQTARVVPGPEKEEVNPGQPNKAPLDKALFSYFLLAALSLIATVTLIIKAMKRKAKIQISPNQVAGMMRFLLEHGTPDTLSMQFRPILQTLKGVRISMNKLYELMPNRVAIINPYEVKDKKELRKCKLTLIDGSDPFFLALKPCLPEIFNLNLLLNEKAQEKQHHGISIPGKNLVAAPQNNPIKAQSESGQMFSQIRHIFSDLYPAAKIVLLAGQKGFQYFKLPLQKLMLGQEQFTLGMLSLPERIRAGKATRREIRDFLKSLHDQVH